MKKTLLLILLAVVALVVSFYLVHRPAGEHDHRQTAGKPLTPLEKLAAAAQEPTDDVKRAFSEYREAAKHQAEKGFNQLLPALARRLSDTVTRHGTPDEIADAALLLHDDGRDEIAEPLLKLAENKLPATAPGETENVYGTEKPLPNDLYMEVVKLLGWKKWDAPDGMDEWPAYDVQGYAGLRDYLRDHVSEKSQATGMYPPETIEKLDGLAAAPKDAWQKLKQQDAKDGYALKARAAWVRFRNAQDSKDPVARAAGRRAFSPLAMSREQEAFGDIWTFQYRGPFVVYLEKPFDSGQNQARLDAALELLRAMQGWFQDRLVEPMKLQRQRPVGNADKAGKQGWPFEVVLFAYRVEFERFVRETTGAQPPDLTSMYATPENCIVACLPRDDELDAWRAGLARSCFELLADTYAADPVTSPEQRKQRPRWSSLLVGDGLADLAANVGIENGEYGFMQLDPAGVKKFTELYDALDSRCLFRLRDLLNVRGETQVAKLAADRANQLGVSDVFAKQNAHEGFRATAELAVYFLMAATRDDRPLYRETWLKYLSDEFHGKHKAKGYDDDAGLKAFEQAFAIKDEAGWDAIEQQFIEFAMALRPEDDGQDNPPEGDK